MRIIFAALTISSFLSLCGPAFAADREAVAHVVEIDLAGEDIAKGTAIVREGIEHKPAIWMPLYDGDIVFLRDPKSRVLVDYGAGGRVEVGQSSMRVEISEDTAHGGETWGLITAIGELLVGEEGEEVPANLISKGDGDALIVPVANRTPNNILRDGNPVWIKWSGGADPFTLTLEADGVTNALTQSGAREARFDIPKDAKQRLVLVIADAKQRSVRVPLRLKETLPAPPVELTSSEAPPEFLPALFAAWLAGQDDGAWRIEVARMLRNADDDNENLKRLSGALFAGWRPK